MRDLTSASLADLRSFEPGSREHQKLSKASVCWFYDKDIVGPGWWKRLNHFPRKCAILPLIGPYLVNVTPGGAMTFQWAGRGRHDENGISSHRR